VCTILPDTPLPTLTDADGVFIDGTTQSTNQGTNNPSGPEIEINGSNIPPILDPPLPADLLKSGLNIASSKNKIKGLIINNFPLNGISIADILGAGVSDNSVIGCCIGTGITCTLDAGNGYDGVYIGSGATNNIVGEVSPGDGNTISWNGWDGVGIHGAGTDSNRVIGNVITHNNLHGVYIYGGAKYNLVGGSSAGERNQIYQNLNNGVRIHGTSTDLNTIAGNSIGTDDHDSSSLGNLGDGIFIAAGASQNIVGGSVSGAGNLISGNMESGVVISGTNTYSNTVSGNLIGTDSKGALDLGNAHHGILIRNSAKYNLIGGDQSEERNVISGNGEDGVQIWGILDPQYNTVAGNYIGTAADGETALPNEESGVRICGYYNTIGGDETGEGNLISGNLGVGVYVHADPEPVGNVISGNLIGTDKYGLAAVPNEVGIQFNWGNHNSIGGRSISERNIISGNRRDGVLLRIGVYQNTISGNFIGTDITGMAALGNGGAGIRLRERSQINLIGGDAPGEANLISGNLLSGIIISETNTISNTVEGNLIGTDFNGEAPLENGEYGVLIAYSAQYNTIGGEIGSSGNLISGNAIDGVHITGSDTSYNTIMGNLIGSDIAGSEDIGRAQLAGISIAGGASSNTIGGISESNRNVIGANETGVVISDTGTIDNHVIGNYIGVDINGLDPLPNYVGLNILGGAQDNTIGTAVDEGENIISGNVLAGVNIEGTDTSNNRIVDNYIGVGVDGIPSLGNGTGIYLYNTHDNIVGNSNWISQNQEGGVVIGGTSSLGNQITRNSLSFNDIGIDLRDGAHGGIAAPEITAVISSTVISGTVDVIGTTCPGCIVEVFESVYAHGEGENYIGEVAASGTGSFTLSSVVIEENFITATATDAALGTSEFSSLYTVLPTLYLPIVRR
jgi:titin